MNMSHLHTLELRLSNERQRLHDAGMPDEKVIRAVWVEQIKKEIEAEKKFLGILDDIPNNLTDEQLLDLLTEE